MDKIALLVPTDGRRSCISRAIPSALDQLHGPVSELVICDDSGDSTYQSWLNRTFPEFDILCGTERLGFGGNIQRAWRYLARNSNVKWVFHCEDDFIFNRPVYLNEMIAVLSQHPYLAQLALRRQAWNGDEKKAGGVVEQHPDAYSDMTDGKHHWLEHRLFFTSNPSLYRIELCNSAWPDGGESEGRFTHSLLSDPAIRFGYWGKRNVEPWVTHIGNERVGSGY